MNQTLTTVTRRVAREPLAAQRALLLAIAMAFGAGAASAGEPLPPEQSQGEISYREGGIGIDEAQAMRAVSAQYPLMLSFAEYVDGGHAYTADVDVRIADPQGQTDLQTHSEGPLMLIDLPPGRYEVTASVDGESQQQTIEVDPRQTRRVYFEWGAI